jgi:branched-chain amino acid transport system substrate-binding protein
LIASIALTKIQSIILISIIAIAAVIGSVAYFSLNDENDIIKIGVLADLDGLQGKMVWQGILLAAEQLNEEGGILGKKIVVVGEDHDIDGRIDEILISSALNRLITFHQVDFVIGQAGRMAGAVVQEIIAQHKILFIDINGGDENPQRVLNDYDKYKYFFSTNYNDTTNLNGATDSFVVLRENTGFNKVGLVGEYWSEDILDGLEYLLPEVYGFEVVYKSLVPYDAFEFSSYFAAAEAAGVEILVPLIIFDGGIPFVKEYHDRQSPLFIYGGSIGGVGDPESWEWTDGKCEYVCVTNTPIVAGYPFTNKTLSTQEAYFNRWGENIDGPGTIAFDDLRYILADAIERAGTIETDAVLEALEETSIETSNSRNFVFTESHTVMMGENPNDPNISYSIMMLFQWQNGMLVPVYPMELMEEAGATYIYPDWPGPWNNID